MKRRIRGALVALALTVSGVAASSSIEAPIANAGSTPCQSPFAPSPSSWFAGFNTHQTSGGDGASGTTTVGGVSANLTYETGTNLCAGNNTINNASLAFVMVEDQPGVGGNGGYAQVGEIYARSQGCLEHFAEDNQSQYTAYTRTIYGTPSGHCAANGQVHTIWVNFDPTGGRYWENVDSYSVQSSSFQPYSGSGSGTWNVWDTQAELNGETHDPNSDVPGNQAHPSLFANVTIQSNPAVASFRSYCGGGFGGSNVQIDNDGSSDETYFWNEVQWSCPTNQMQFWVQNAHS